MRTLKSLTGIRGVAAMAVIMYHFNTKIFTHGYLSVDLFFILSGFILCSAYSSKFEQTVSIGDYFSFIENRIIRVYPLYIFLTICFLLVKGPDSPARFFSNLSLIGGIGWQEEYLGTAWSLSIEAACYLVLPILLCMTYRSKGVKYVWLIAAFMGLAYISKFHSPFILGSQGDAVSGPLDLWVFDGAGAKIRGVCDFLLGIAAFSFLRKMGPIKPFWGGLAQDFLFLFVIFVFGISGKYHFDLLFVLASFLLIPLLSREFKCISGWILSSSVVYFLGEISFSVYLVHQTFSRSLIKTIDTKFNWIPTWGVGVLYVIITLILATLLYLIVENPSRKYLRRKFSNMISSGNQSTFNGVGR